VGAADGGADRAHCIRRTRHNPRVVVSLRGRVRAVSGLLDRGSSIFMYRITLESGQFEIIKDHRPSDNDARLQVLLIAFAFGAFLEGAAGFGAPGGHRRRDAGGTGDQPVPGILLCLLATPRRSRSVPSAFRSSRWRADQAAARQT